MEMEYGDDATRRLHQEGVSYGKGFDRQAIMTTTKVSAAIHPGEHIAEELAERGMSAAELARAMDVDAGRVSRLLNGKVSVTGDTALRLAATFGTSAEYWMRLQGDYELTRAREARDASR